MKRNGVFCNEAARTDTLIEVFEQERMPNMKSRKELDKSSIKQLGAAICDKFDEEDDQILVLQMECNGKAEFVSFERH